MGQPRYIICLQNGSTKIYYMPSEWVGRDISTPLQSGSAEIYHMPSEQVSQDISHAFRTGQPAYIHPLSQWVSPDISHAFTMGGPTGWAQAIPAPSKHISHSFLSLKITTADGYENWTQVDNLAPSQIYIYLKEGEGQGPPDCPKSRQKKAIGMVSSR